jgi:hypothetical protein
MSKISEEVLKDFYSRLEKAEEVGAGMCKELRTLLDAGSRPKVDDLVAVFEQKKEQKLP